MSKKLDLNKETLRDLADETLQGVAGGDAITTTCPLYTQTPVCPSGATWLWDCESVQVSCG